MANITFILGGARSGKSRFSVDKAKSLGDNVLYVATCVPQDEEMQERVMKHKQSRPKHWKTLEEGYDIAGALQKCESITSLNAILIDCLTMYVSNLVLANKSEEDIFDNIKNIKETLKNIDTNLMIVSNEVGSGIVPENALARKFRDIAGVVNQKTAEFADQVYLITAGIPVKIK